MQLSKFRLIHKWLSLVFLTVWILQAASGLMIAFRADIDDFLLRQKPTKTDNAAIAATIDDMLANGDDISSVWFSGGRDGQYDAYLERDGESRTVRIDGVGNRVRDRSDSNLFSDGAVFETATQFHKTLLLGSVGYTFLTISGLLLVSNIAMGLTIGWSRRKRLTAFAQAPNAPKPASLSGWHWRVGFWGALPASVVILSGTALAQADVIANWLGVTQNAPAITDPARTPHVPLEHVLDTALKQYPGSTLTAISLPSENRPWYQIRVNAPGEMPRLYGATRVFVGLDGKVLLEHDAANSAANERITEALYPLHTGQIGGLPGRLLNFATGIWLLVMITLGIQLWLARRRQRQSKSVQGDT